MLNRFFVPLILAVVTFSAKAQETAPEYQAYGKVSVADLKMTSCDFEKDANAEILFDVGKVDEYSPSRMERHTRIKVFNEQGLNQANVRLLFHTYNINDVVNNVKAETININNGKIEITPVDKKLIYTQKVDRFTSALVFAFPDVKPGSVIECKYDCPFEQIWYFQHDVPTRYSEIQIGIPGTIDFKFIPHVNQPFIKNVGGTFDHIQDKALANIPSLQDEPYMGSRQGNLQRVEFITNIMLLNTWGKIGYLLLRLNDFGYQLSGNLAGESGIINQAKNLKTDDGKIAFIFNLVKNRMKWNGITSYFTVDGASLAWDKSTGNSAEINMALYRLLKKAKIQAYPLLVSNKDYGQLNPFIINPYSFNNFVVYIPSDTANTDNGKYYLLDATNKFNLFNVAPKEYLDSFGLMIDESHSNHKVVFIDDKQPERNSVFLNAEVTADGKMSGTVELTNSSYDKINYTEHYKTDGETKYIDYLKDKDNSINISTLKMENMDSDTLPLIQDFKYAMDLAGTDDNYIYFTPNLFANMGKNPFMNRTRFTDIDFGYRNDLAVTGVYKTPAGYKIDAVPKNVTMTMPDTSIIFRRTVAQQEGTVMVRYSIEYKKNIYFKEDYANLYEFYKKMYEMLNEQVVLKKS